MANLSLEQFLEQERSAGSRQSSGSFTIDFSVALEKLRKFQLQDPNFFVLKLLQSATVVGARNLTLKLGRDALELSFTLDEPGRYGELNRLVVGLSKPPSGHSEMDYLISGLQASLAAEASEVRWSHLRGQKLEVALCSVNGVELQRRFDRSATPGLSQFRFQMKRKKPQGFWAALRGSRRIRLETYSAVLERCGLLPLDFTVDGRPVERLTLKATPILIETAPRRALDQGFLIRLPTSRNRRGITVVDSRGRPQTTKPGELLRCRTVVAPSRGGKLHWVKDGVIISSETTSPNTLLNQTAWLSATQLRTDLSGFEVVRNSALEAELKRISILAADLRQL